MQMKMNEKFDTTYEMVMLINIGIQIEMKEIKEGKVKTKTLDKILEKYKDVD